MCIFKTTSRAIRTNNNSKYPPYFLGISTHAGLQMTNKTCVYDMWNPQNSFSLTAICHIYVHILLCFEHIRDFQNIYKYNTKYVYTRMIGLSIFSTYSYYHIYIHCQSTYMYVGTYIPKGYIRALFLNIPTENGVSRHWRINLAETFFFEFFVAAATAPNSIQSWFFFVSRKWSEYTYIE